MPHLTVQHISLVFLIAGALSLVLHEPLARLDSLLVKGGPTHMEQARLRIASNMVVGTGVALMTLAVVLVRFQ